jgi:hypothetical protein
MCEYHQFQRQRMLYHQEHVQHDNDHRLLVRDDMVISTMNKELLYNHKRQYIRTYF